MKEDMRSVGGLQQSVDSKNDMRSVGGLHKCETATGKR